MIFPIYTFTDPYPAIPYYTLIQVRHSCYKITRFPHHIQTQYIQNHRKIQSQQQNQQ